MFDLPDAATQLQFLNQPLRDLIASAAGVGIVALVRPKAQASICELRP